jgi:diadenosine tetraphosphate (Ap4A) HIT family hydrolase
VIPKQELEWMDDYDDATVAHCMVVAKKLMKHIKTTLSDIHFVYLAVEGLEVPHWHIHLMPYAQGVIHPHVDRH